MNTALNWICFNEVFILKGGRGSLYLLFLKRMFDLTKISDCK